MWGKVHSCGLALRWTARAPWWARWAVWWALLVVSCSHPLMVLSAACLAGRCRVLGFSLLGGIRKYAVFWVVAGFQQVNLGMYTLVALLSRQVWRASWDRKSSTSLALTFNSSFNMWQVLKLECHRLPHGKPSPAPVRTLTCKYIQSITSALLRAFGQWEDDFLNWGQRKLQNQ